jgi:hypothetical protein
MTASAAKRRLPRAATGAKLSATLQRWPARNYFAELEPRSRDVHPIDELMDRQPHVRRIRRRTRRFLARIQKQARTDDVLDFEAERNLLDSSRVEAAFNLGFENGLVLGRAEGIRGGARRPRDRLERLLMLDLRAALARTKASPRRVEALLLALAWALSVGGDPVGRRVTRHSSSNSGGSGM